MGETAKAAARQQDIALEVVKLKEAKNGSVLIPHSR